MLQKKLGSIENESRTNIKKGKRKKERTADKKRKVKQKKYRKKKNRNSTLRRLFRGKFF